MRNGNNFLIEKLTEKSTVLCQNGVREFCQAFDQIIISVFPHYLKIIYKLETLENRICDRVGPEISANRLKTDSSAEENDLKIVK